jgi:hypothetical protein
MEPTPEHVKIDSIKLSLNGLVVELKPEQAKLLWQQLDDLFGPRPAAPVWIWPTYPFHYLGDPIYAQGPTCGGTSIMVNPNDEPFPDKWVVTYNAYTGNCLEINT